MKKHIYSSIYNLKHNNETNIIIQSSIKNIIFTLKLLSINDIQDAMLISLLSSWRKKVLHFMPSTKPITIKGTQKWLKEKVMEENDRLLFLVVANDKSIGHVGLYRYNPKDNSIVIDNVIRGVAGYPGIMAEAIVTLIRWAKKTLSIDSFFVDCSSDNEKAIALYKRIGFKEIRREPLIKVKTDGGYVFRDAPKNDTGPITYYRVVFRYN